MEFPAMMRHVQKVKEIVESAGVKFVTLRAEHDFEYYMLRYEPKRNISNLERFGKTQGHSWPSAKIRWCTGLLKKSPIDKYLRDLRKQYNIIQYIGLAADEQYRLERKNNQQADMRHPLVEWGWTEADALAYCRQRGFDWEGLYDLFKRVSCWLCPLQSLGQLRILYEHFPDLWQKLREYETQTYRTFLRDYSVFDLEKRFDLEAAMESIGESTRNRAFYDDLRLLKAGETTIDDILSRRQPTQLTVFDDIVPKGE